MSVELYLIKPDAEGRVVFPFWDGEVEQPGIEYVCLDSLKWATYHDPDERLYACGLGLRETPIPAAELVAGATLGLQQLMHGLLALHPDFAQWLPADLEDPAQYDAVWDAFLDEATWLGATAAVRTTARLKAQGPWSGFKMLFERIRDGGQRGFVGCWSY